MADTVHPRRRGRPRIDPASFCDPKELLRRPFLVLEPDDARYSEVEALFAPDRFARPIARLRALGEAEDALGHHADFAGWLLPHAVSRRTTISLLSRLRARAPKVPIYVCIPVGESAQGYFDTGARCWPGMLEAGDVAVMLERAERFEQAPISHFGYVVRRGRLFAPKDRPLQLHEARFVAAKLKGVPDSADRKVRSEHSLGSRALRKLSAPNVLALLQERLQDWRIFGGQGQPPWMA